MNDSLQLHTPPLRAFDIRFTGSGSEYFRIWIVNLLLTIVTLGIYYPFAKVRRLRYFHANTLVGGHALGFHGEPLKMLRGYALVAVLAMLYSAASNVSPLSGALAALLLAALWPLLWHTSLRFRLANTSWRGLRFAFTGSLGGAYRALLPVLVIALVFVAAPAFVGDGKSSLRVAMVVGLAALAALLLTPYLLARVKRYQHGHYQFAGDTTRLDAPVSAFYGLWLRASLVSLLPLLLVVGGMVVVLLPLDGATRRADSFAVSAGTVAVLLFYLLLFVLIQPFFTARLQNLVWGRTRSPRLRFESTLHFRDLALLTLANLLLMIVTLGLYRPFAAVRTARLRLEAVAIVASGNVDEWAGNAANGMRDASGDAAGDLLGIDLGL